MVNPILTTKLYIPQPRSELVSRPRLIKRLNDGSRCKLTLIAAPAGFGKTTLLSDWIAGMQLDAEPESRPQDHVPGDTRRVAWLSLDDGDNDLRSFLLYVVAALQTVNDNFGLDPLTALHSSGAVNTEVILTTLLNEIAKLPDDVVLILDDYHVIESQPVDLAIAFLLDHLPAQMHLVIATRIDPSMPLSLLRARGQMCEIRADSLRFTTDEAADFLNQMMGFDLSPEDVAALEARTEGWITGLQLAALSMQGSDDVQGFVRSFTGSNRYILDYLGEEVFSYQPPHAQDFLLKTSILTRLTGALCDAITGRSDGEQTLAELERGNLFIIPLDNERRWYRYHHLFVDLLRRRLKQTRPELASALHSQAGDWYARHGFHSEAVHHALAGQNTEMAADLIEANGLRLIGQGAFTTLLKWIDALPESTVRERPYLCVYHAWTSSFTHQVDAIEPYLHHAERALQALDLPADDDTSKSLVGHIATLRAWNARRRRENALAISLLEDAGESQGEDSPFVRTFADLNLGLAYMDDGELVKGANALRRAVLQANASKNNLAGLMAASHLAAILILQGRLHEAETLCRQTIREQLARHEKPPPTLCVVYLRLGWVLAEWNDIDGFYANLTRAVTLADQIGYESVVAAGSRAMAWERELLAKQGTFVELSDEVTQIIDRALTGDSNPRPVQIQNTAVYLGDDSYFEIWPGYSDHARARRLAEEGKLDEALSLLAQIVQSAEAVDGIGLIIEARTLAALMYQSQGELDHAVESLKDALVLGAPEGYIRTFVDRDSSMTQLLAEAAARGIMPDYVRTLLAAFKGGALDDAKPPPQALIEPLSTREIEILQLIAQGLSNREIGERLFIALDTVKGHNHRLFGKLGVRRRTEAVDRARTLGLL